MVMTAVFVLALLVGVPVLAAIGLATLVPIAVDGVLPLTMVVQTLYTGVDQFPLIAVTGFILAGALMTTGGITERIVDVAAALVGRWTGGLAICAILASMFFASISGSGPATVAAIGGLMLPGMVRRGYAPAASAAAVASGGTLGILIPPSNPMIIYGVIGNVSITKMFMAGLVPGLLVGSCLMAAAWLVARRRGYRGEEGPFDPARFRAALRRARWSLLAPVLILGGIYGGVFTPVEASAVSVLYALVVGALVYRELDWAGFLAALRDTAITSGTVVVIVGIALAFGRLLTLYQIPVLVADSLTTLTSDPVLMLALIALFLIVIGTFMETLAQIVILVPVFLPVTRELGIDPLHFGIVFVVCCEIGFLTPPLGANLYVAAKQARLSLEAVSLAAVPYLVALLAALILLILFPSLSLFLPGLLAS
ncbi:TRAP transporter large permease (plasmid) [Geminicoccaceae bacterium 1502E]|nr:TRAP transporter large permease [Geminicoccaceae bacterium 1502E]